MKSGDIMSPEDKTLCSYRKKFWIDFLDNISDDTGFFDPEEPRLVCVANKRYESILQELSTKIFEKVFWSLESIPYMGVLVELLTVQGFRFYKNSKI
jgi:hypothetical protein